MGRTGESRHTAGIVERGDVLDALEQLLDDAHEGRGGALFVVGPAGLGKTTVLEHASIVAKPRFAIGIGRGDQVEAVLPFGLIGQVLDHLLAGKLPGGTVAPDTVAPDTVAPDAGCGEGADVCAQSRFYGILRGIREAAVRPLLLALDDLHWSDPDSLTMIHLICRRLVGRPVAVESANDLTAQGLAKIQQLAPLSTAAVRELLCSQVHGEVPVAIVDQAVDLCGGNPLLVEQVAAQLGRDGKLPETQVWFSRFVGVGAAGRRYLQAASVLDQLGPRNFDV